MEVPSPVPNMPSEPLNDGSSAVGKPNLNQRLSKSLLGRYFKLEDRKTTFTREILAGTVSFVAMAYIVAVNASILTDSGGMCQCNTQADPDCTFNDPKYQQCLQDLQRALITSTAVSAMIGTLFMGLGANMPVLLAPGMGLNAYFAYTVVGFHGSGNISYENALGAVFVEGLVFLTLSITGIRTLIAKAIPVGVKAATGAGIGLFITFIGLQKSNGIFLVGFNGATLVGLAGCPEEYEEAPIYDGIPASNVGCTEGRMESAITWIGITAFILMAVMLARKVRAAVIIGILAVAFTSWFRGTTFTFFPYTPEGESKFAYFKQIIGVGSLEPVAFKMNFDLGNSEIWVALVTMLYVDLLDTTGTLYSIAKFGGFLTEDGHFENEKWAFSADALATMTGAVVGTSPVTSLVESAAGISVGGRTGLTAVTGSFLFFLAIFFNPLLVSIPPWATGPALILTGALMMRVVSTVDWDNIYEAAPAFVTIALMPMTYSIAYGLIGGIITSIVLHTCLYVVAVVNGERSWVEFSKPFVCKDGESNSEARTTDAEFIKDHATCFNSEVLSSKGDSTIEVEYIEQK